MLRASEVSPRMFKSDLIDFFSRTPWWVIPTLWIPVSIGFFLLGLNAGVAIGWGALAWFTGWFMWSLAEYGLHRTAFHWIPKYSWGEQFHFLLHGVHHKWVNDPFRLVMPPAASLFLCVVFGGLFRMLFGPVWMWPLFSGFVFGYVVYDCMHYAEHHLKVNWKWFVRLRAHHMSHHHNKKYMELRFGVSTRIWDYVFRTAEPRKA